MLSGVFLGALACEAPPVETLDAGSEKPLPLPIISDGGPVQIQDAGGNLDAGFFLDGGSFADAGKRGPTGPALGYNPSATGKARSNAHRVQISVGTPLPKGTAQSANHRLRLTPMRNPTPRAAP